MTAEKIFERRPTTYCGNSESETFEYSYADRWCSGLLPLVAIQDEKQDLEAKGPTGPLANWKRAANAVRTGARMWKAHRNEKKADGQAPAPGFEDGPSASSTSTAKPVTKPQPKPGTTVAKAQATLEASIDPETALLNLLQEVRQEKSSANTQAGTRSAGALAAAQKFKGLKNRKADKAA